MGRFRDLTGENVFEILLVLAAAPTAVPGPFYENDALHAFLAVANDRVIDGISYTDGRGTASIGAIYSHPAGFFGGAEYAVFHGPSATLPGERASSLDSFAGWETGLGKHRFALELLDYRLDAGSAARQAHQGIGLRYRWRQLDIEYATERDKPYFHHPHDAFYSYDIERAVLAWQQPVTPDLEWAFAVGAQQVEGIDVGYHFVTGGLQWQWQDLEWQLAVTLASDDAERLAGAGGSSVLLRIAWPFRLL